nr:F-box/LRR-repeat protein At3g03360-like isoform X2 [Nicotiana tomentosiformis]
MYEFLYGDRELSNHSLYQTFRVVFYDYEEKSYVKDVDLWVHFAIKVANVEDFTLEIESGGQYEVPQFAYKNTSLRNLVLCGCKLNPSGSVNWSSLVSLSIRIIELTDGAMGKVLSGCPNLECLELYNVSGIHRLEISSVKLRKLVIDDYMDGKLEILAPYIQHLQISGLCDQIHLRQRNVASLVTAVLGYSNFEWRYEEDNFEEEFSYLKEFLHGVAQVENLELGPWCIELLSILSDKSGLL